MMRGGGVSCRILASAESGLGQVTGPEGARKARRSTGHPYWTLPDCLFVEALIIDHLTILAPANWTS